MAANYDVVISLLVYNQLQVTKECLDSLFKTAISNYLLILSDNNSNKETAAYLRALASNRDNVVYIRNDDNLGFIKAHNAVFEAYSYLSDHFCVLNNDLIFHSKGWDTAFLSALQADAKLSQVGPVQAYGSINSRGVGVKRPDRNRPPEYIEGSCFVVKTAAIGDKLFESKYMQFAFCEDADLSFRLRNAGYSIEEITGISIQHKHHVSFKNEKLSIDFKALERENQRFLVDRWQKYMKLRKFLPTEILIIRTGALGDSFMIEPITRELLNKYPGCNIYVQTKCPDWAKNSPYIKECGANIRTKRKYDIVIDLDMAYERKPKMHVIDAYADTAMVIVDGEKRTPQYHGIGHTGKVARTVTINAEGSWASRQWPLDRIKAFAEYLVGKEYTVKEVGRNPKMYTGTGENLVGKLSFDQVVKTIAESELYFGMDGGLAHFAQAVGTDCLLVFGCTNPAYRVHNKGKVRTLWIDNLPCAGCHHEGPPKTFTACKTGNHACLTGITVDQVINQFKEWEIERNSQA